MFAIRRRRTEWDDFIYSCEECNSESHSVASLNHEMNCPVNNPDDIEYSFHNTTKEMIDDIIREIEWRLESVDYITELDSLKDIKGVRWDDRGSSSRIALGLGRTSKKGYLHTEDRKGLVLKVDPRIRFDEESTSVSANLDELFIWEKAIETNTSQFFADIYAASRDGMWLVMEECIPIYKSRGKVQGNKDAIFDHRGEEYIGPLRDILYENNWINPDYKYGNIGLTDEGVPVVLDYGTGPDYKEK